MSLCSPAVASGSTARPPGTKKCSPDGKERPMAEKSGVCYSHGQFYTQEFVRCTCHQWQVRRWPRDTDLQNAKKCSKRRRTTQRQGGQSRTLGVEKCMETINRSHGLHGKKTMTMMTYERRCGMTVVRMIAHSQAIHPHYGTNLWRWCQHSSVISRRAWSIRDVAGAIGSGPPQSCWLQWWEKSVCHSKTSQISQTSMKVCNPS